MAVLIQNLLDALSCENGASLAIFRGAIPQLDDDGGVVIYCTSYFAEVKVELSGELYMMMLPLKKSATIDLFNRVKLLKKSSLGSLADYRLLRGELSYVNSFGQIHYSDLIAYRIPQGTPLCDLIQSGGVDWQSLLEASYHTQELFAAARVCHNNLKASNIIVTQRYELLPIRYVDSVFDVEPEAVANEFDALREWFCQCGGIDYKQREGVESPQCRADYDSVEGEFEGLRCFSRDGLYGYLDSYGKEVIEAQYIWAERFREGRAEVITDGGMGLINNRGEYIIPAVNQIVDYDLNSGYARVKCDDMWAIFDHNGVRVTPFSRSYICESAMQNIDESIDSLVKGEF